MPDKKAQLRCGTPPLKFVVGDVLEIPKTVQTVVIVVLGCLTKLHGKASLLKTIAEGTTYTGVRGYGETKWVLTRTHPTSNTN